MRILGKHLSVYLCTVPFVRSPRRVRRYADVLVIGDSLGWQGEGLGPFCSGVRTQVRSRLCGRECAGRRWRGSSDAHQIVRGYPTAEEGRYPVNRFLLWRAE